MKHWSVLFLTACAFTARAQNDYNPFASIGKKAKIVTASNGEIQEFNYDTIQRFGSVFINIKTRKIVKLLDANKTFAKATDNSAQSRWYRPDPMAEKYYSQSPYLFALNNPILLNDPDGRDVDPTNLKGKDNLNAFKNILSTKAGYKMIGQFMHKGASLTVTIGGKTTTFTFNKEGSRANDMLKLISSPNAELNPSGHGDAGLPRTGVTSETEKNDNKNISDDKNYDVRKGVAFNIYVEKELSETESTNTMAHELSVHVETNVNRLEAVENKMTDGTLKPGTPEYLNQLKNIQNSGDPDHQNLGKGLNKNYLNLSAQLDKLFNTNQYTELYQKDVNANK